MLHTYHSVSWIPLRAMKSYILHNSGRVVSNLSMHELLKLLTSACNQYCNLYCDYLLSIHSVFLRYPVSGNSLHLICISIGYGVQKHDYRSVRVLCLIFLLHKTCNLFTCYETKPSDWMILKNVNSSRNRVAGRHSICRNNITFW